MISLRPFNRLALARTIMADPQRRAALAGLSAAASRAPDFVGFDPEALLAWQPRGTVARGTLRGRKVVVKHLSHPDGAARICRMVAELDYLVAHSIAGQPLMAPHLLSDADAGLIAVEVAPGKIMADAIGAADADRRARLRRLAGGWLSDYARLRQRRGRLRPGRDLSSLGAIAGRLDGKDGERLARLSAWQRARVARLGRRPLTLAAVHDDFHSRNLTVDGDRLCGFDCAGESWMPPLRAAARFLTQNQMSNPLWHGPQRHGIALTDRDGILAGLGLPAEETRPLLPLFIAEELGGILWRTRDRQRRLRLARRMVDSFLADLG